MSLPSTCLSISQNLKLRIPSPLSEFKPDWPGADCVEIRIKRDDAIHPVISGNKWRKLKYTLEALPENCRHIVSFGGGFSNHLHACGFICKTLGLTFTAMVRGDYSSSMTPMLNDLDKWGSEIRFISKKEYKDRTNPDWLKKQALQYPDAFFIPEGGSQVHALKGVSEILKEDTFFPDYILLPVASGATLAGIVNASSLRQKTIGIAVLKGKGYLEDLVSSLLPLDTEQPQWHIEHGYHQGGYAKTSAELATLCHCLSTHYDLSVEPVYSGKVFLSLKDMLAKNVFKPGSRILVIHTGGLQGARKM